MYLSKLKMKGFKSFAQSTEIKFSQGISAIAGPNGSGKSNITDAIRWVLGEQSTKSLRGKKMEDVIFAGTVDKAPLGYAEVSLFLDNSDGGLKDYPGEVQVTRRLFRTGESEYQLNQKPCKLKDIQQIFMDTGLGKNGYSLISQGEIEKIITSGAQELRNIVEEAVGIVSYKTKKLEAERKLSRTQDNMDRVLDILNELEKRRGPLQRQAKKAREYLAIHGELKNIDLLRFVSMMDDIEKQHQDLACQLMSAEVRINTINQKNTEQDCAYQQNREELEAVQKEMSEIEVQLAENEKSLSTLFGEILVSEERCRYFETERQRLKSQEEQERQIFEARIQSKEQAEKALLAAEIESNTLRQTLADLQKRVSALQNQSDRFKAKQIEMQAQEAEKAQIKLDLNDQIQAKREILSGETARKEMVAAEILRVQKELTSGDQKRLPVQQSFDALGESIQDLRKKEKVEEQKAQALTQEVTRLEETLNVTDNQLAFNRSKIAYLKGIQANYADYFPGIQHLMTSDHFSSFEKKQILGPVGELIQVPAVYVKAIDAALGAKVQNIVVSSVSTASKCIDFLKAQRLGRATFLPLDHLRYKKAEDKDRQALSVRKGFLGIASDLVTTEKACFKAIESLLGRVIVVSDFQSGTLINKAFPGYSVVTLEGEIFLSGGAIVGGTFQKDRKSPITKKGEIELMTAESDRLESEKADLIRDLGSKRQAREEVKANLNQIYHQLQEQDQQQWQLRHQLQGFQDEKKRKESQISVLEQDQIRLENRIQALCNEICTLEDQLILLSEQTRKHDVSEEMLPDEGVMAEFNQKMTETQVLLAQKGEQEKQLRSACDTLNFQISEQNQKLNTLAQSIEKNEKETQTQKDLLDVQRQEEAQAKQEKENLQNKRQALLVRQSTLRINIDALSQSIGTLNHELVEENDAKNKIILAMERLSGERDHQNETIYARYEMNLLMAQDAVAKIDIQELDASPERQQALRRQLTALGHVNVGAIEESTEVEERYHFMKTQYDDLSAAKNDLEKIIGDMGRSMEKQFTERFAQLQTIFTRVFSVLFEGGTAHLAYSDPDHVMTSGIDLTAQPPGKKLRHISLLSGGETAMTAIALLFSFLELNPSPFCVIDEIDAALDDRNIMRFTGYMMEMSKKSQFMLITHRKKTLEACDAIYGVSMNKSGVSKLISVKLSDYEEKA